MVLAAWPAWVVSLLMVLFFFICVVFILAILIQKPQGGGLAAAFGGSSGSGQTAFGTKTGDALTVATIIVFTLYLVFAVVLNAGTAVQKVVNTPEAAPATPTEGNTGTAPAPAPANPMPCGTGTAAPESTPRRCGR